MMKRKQQAKEGRGKRGKEQKKENETKNDI